MLPAILLLLGEALGASLRGPSTPWSLLGTLALLSALRVRAAARATLLGVAGLSFGVAIAAARTPGPPPPPLVGEGRFEVTLDEDGRADADGIDVIVRARRPRRGEGVLWTGSWPVRLTSPRWPVGLGPGKRGETWLIEGRLQPPGRRAIDPRAWIRASERNAALRLRGTPRWDPHPVLDDLVLGLQARLRTAILRDAPADVEALDRALVVGDRDGMGGVWEDRFARTGTVHLLSISGLHVTATGVPAAWVLRWLLRRGPAEFVAGGAADAVATVAAVLVALVYVLAAGGPIPAWRSWAMLATAAGARLLDRQMPAWNVLASSALAVGIADPGAVRGLGFQLSFLSVAGLLASAEVVEPLLAGRPRVIRVPCLLLAASLGTFLLTSPLLALRFDVISPAALWSNLVAIPLLGEVTMLPLLAGAAASAAAPGLGAPALHVAAWPARLGLAAIEWFADPARCPQVAWAPSAASVAAIYAVLGAWVVRRHTAWRSR